MTPPQLQSAVVASALATSAALAEENVVYWVSAPVQPGETVMMCGYFPQPDAVEIAVERLADRDPGEPFGQPWQPPGDKSLPEPVKPLQTSETALMFELPKYGAPGVYYYAVHSTAAAAYASDASTCLRLGGRSATSSLPTPLLANGAWS